ncbi:MAG: hypothetical protein ABI433_07310 [Burkholderiaceae bacterium]
MQRTPKSGIDVSSNNPCPFLRALVAEGLLPDDKAPIGAVAKSIVAVAANGDGAPKLPEAAVRAIALVANGLTPLQLARNGVGGLRLNELRGGPLDKQGAGSGILDREARISQAELDRLDQFAGDKLDADGGAERGLGLSDLNRMMDANFERASGRRRRIDRRLMNGEWPILLRVMGKQGKTGRYLSVADVRVLFLERRLPERMVKPLDDD